MYCRGNCASGGTSQVSGPSGRLQCFARSGDLPVHSCRLRRVASPTTTPHARDAQAAEAARVNGAFNPPPMETLRRSPCRYLDAAAAELLAWEGRTLTATDSVTFATTWSPT